MKKRFIAVAFLCAAFFGAFSDDFSNRSSAVLFAQTADSQPFAPPTLQQKDAWTLVLIPDPQAYSRYGRNQGIFELTPLGSPKIKTRSKFAKSFASAT